MGSQGQCISLRGGTAITGLAEELPSVHSSLRLVELYFSFPEIHRRGYFDIDRRLVKTKQCARAAQNKFRQSNPKCGRL